MRSTVSPVDYNNDGTPYHVLLLFQDINQDKEEAMLDGLTGIFNRSYGEKTINDFIVSPEFKCAAFAVVDIDNFKQINDKFGHQKGDEALQLVAKKISSLIKNDSITCRIGGDEFVIFIQSDDFSSSVEQIKELCQGLNILISNQNEYAKISLSIGVVETPRYGNRFSELYAKADRAAYFSKQHGKNRVSVFSENLFENDESKILLKEFELALKNKDIKIFYQPVVDAYTGKISSLEALSRWFHPEKGIIPPNKFVT